MSEAVVKESGQVGQAGYILRRIGQESA